MDFKAEVYRVHNGWKVILKYNTPGYKDEELVYEDGDKGGGDRDSFPNVVYALMDYCGISGSKHDKKRLVCGNIENWEDFIGK
jgi:hypothetical protein